MQQLERSYVRTKIEIYSLKTHSLGLSSVYCNKEWASMWRPFL